MTMMEQAAEEEKQQSLQRSSAAIPCPAGRYNDEVGQISCKECEAGYYCTEASVSPRNLACGNASYYCPPSSGWPTPVDSGYYTIGPKSEPEQLQDDNDAHIRYSQILCERGYYCVHGVRYECPKGYYGGETGLTDSSCSGKCTPGYICDEASIGHAVRCCAELCLGAAGWAAASARHWRFHGCSSYLQVRVHTHVWG